MRTITLALAAALLLIGCQSKHQRIRGGGFEGGAQITVDPAPSQSLALALSERPADGDDDTLLVLTVTASHAEGGEGKAYLIDGADAKARPWAEVTSSPEGDRVELVFRVRGDDVTVVDHAGEVRGVDSDGSFDATAPLLPLLWDYRNIKLFSTRRKARFDVTARGVDFFVTIRERL